MGPRCHCGIAAVALTADLCGYVKLERERTSNLTLDEPHGRASVAAEAAPPGPSLRVTEPQEVRIRTELSLLPVPSAAPPITPSR